MLEYLRESSLNVPHNPARREFLRQSAGIAVALVASGSVPLTATFFKTAARYLMALDEAERRAEREAKAMKQRKSLKREGLRAMEHEDQSDFSEQREPVSPDVAAQTEDGSSELSPSAAPSENLRSEPVLFPLDTRPPKRLGDFADRAYLTMDGRRRWKQQESLPLPDVDMPEFDGEHSAEAYLDIILHFNADDPENARYAATGSTTFCNIYVSDVTSAMGVPIPRWNNGEKMWTDTIYEWLTDPSQGEFLGWEQVLPFVAQEVANAGFPAVVITKPNGSLGHMAMVIPNAGEGEIYRGTYSPLISQAGLENFIGRSAYTSAQFRDREIVYFVNRTGGYQFIPPEEAGP